MARAEAALQQLPRFLSPLFGGPAAADNNDQPLPFCTAEPTRSAPSSMNRSGLPIELDPLYVDVIIRRY